MSHLSTTFRVGAPPDTVFDLVADPSRAPEWQTMITEMGEISGRPGGVGSSYIGFYRVAGRRIEGHFIVTAAERPTLLQAAGTTRGGWARWTTVIEAIDGGSEVRVDLEYDLPGELIGSLFGILTGNRLEQEFRRTYDNLRELAEAEADPAGHRRPPRSGRGRGKVDAGGRVAPVTRDAPDTPDDEGPEASIVAEPVRARAV
jgi:uncharacterized protein YndB with AHSA1/START domain